MSVFQRVLSLGPRSRGLHEVTAEVAAVVGESPVDSGMCNVFLQHTSASLCSNENADPTARGDLEVFLDRLVPEDEPYFRHTHEGPDDMPSHIKNVLTETSPAIPVVDGRMALGTWQGLYLWEHRDRATGRRLVVSVW